MSDEWSITPSDWQGVDDEPTAGSHNLVKSDGAFNAINSYQNSSIIAKEVGLTTIGFEVTSTSEKVLLPRPIPKGARIKSVIYGVSSINLIAGYETENATSYQALSANVVTDRIIRYVKCDPIDSNYRISFHGAIPEILIPLQEKVLQMESTLNLDDYTIGTFYINKTNGYLMSNGKFAGLTNTVSKTTSKIPCKEGDVFLYKGVGRWSAVSALFYDDTGSISSSAQYNSPNAYVEVTIPSGITGVLFSSFSESQDFSTVVFDVYRKNPISMDYLSKFVESSDSIFIGKKIIYEGDSICAGNETYAKMVADMCGMPYTNYAVGGATIAKNTYNPDSTPRHWICDSIASMSQNADYILFEGGLNDYWQSVPLGTLSAGFNATLDETTFYGAFESTIKKLYNRFAGKKIGFIAAHPVSNGWSIDGAYYSAAIQCCKKWGVPVCDFIDKVPPFYKFSSGSDLYNNLTAVYTKNADTTHPTAAAYQIWFNNAIIEFLKQL